METEFLSICIPTRNRRVWLDRALSCLADELDSNRSSMDAVNIYISDNCSNDDTESVVRQARSRLPHLDYFCQPSNIGGELNLIYCSKLGAGEYRWVMGDDDAIYPGALKYILGCLQDLRPALFINCEGKSAYSFKPPALFANYREFSKICEIKNPYMLLAHSLITASIFRSDCFNYDFALSRVGSCYCHMYGMIEAMADDEGSVFVADRQTMTVRNSSLDPVDGVWPVDMYKIWGDYLDWVKSRFGLTTLDRNRIPVYIRQALLLELKKHPIEVALHHAKNLHRAQTWISLFKIIKGS